MSYAKTQYLEKQKKLNKTEKAIAVVTERLRALEAVANTELQTKVAPHREAVEKLQKAHQQTFTQKNSADIAKIQQLEARRERLQAQMVKFADSELTGTELKEDDPSLKDVPSDGDLDEEIEKMVEEAPEPAVKPVEAAK